MPNPTISHIKLPSGATYDIKDAQARSDISTIQTQIETLSGIDAVTFKGVSTTALTDGGAQNPTVGGEQKTPSLGELYFYGTSEFVWGGDNKWHELGSLDNLGDLAYQDTASATYTPAGSVSVSTKTTANKTATVSTTSGTATYTPAGSVAAPTFTGTQATISSTATYTPAGSVSFTNGNKTATVAPASSGTATYTPAGSVAAPTFTGTAATISSSATYTPAGSVSFSNSNQTATVSSTTGTATYTPAGSVAAPTISVATAGSTGTIHNPTKVTVAKTVVAAAPGATAPANSLTYYSVSDETLSLYQLGYTTGDSITTSDVTVKTGDASYSATAPAFTGTGVRLVTGNISVPTSASFSGTEATISSSASYTPAGSNNAPAFTGTGVRLVTGNISVPTSASFTGTEGTISSSATYTPAGNNSAPDFTGTGVRLVTGNIPVPDTYNATFTGTQETITVS